MWKRVLKNNSEKDDRIICFRRKESVNLWVEKTVFSQTYAWAMMNLAFEFEPNCVFIFQIMTAFAVSGVDSNYFKSILL